jgi:hypothetical protein
LSGYKRAKSLAGKREAHHRVKGVGRKETAVQERRITSSALMADLDNVLEHIAQCPTAFIVELDTPTFRGDREFVLGPAAVCGAVLGLVDSEYGWPHPVEAREVEDVMELAPGYRRHPFIYRNGECLAVGIQMSEYKDIERKSSQSGSRSV